MMKVSRLHLVAMYLENKIRDKGFNVNYKVKNIYWDYGEALLTKLLLLQM